MMSRAIKNARLMNYDSSSRWVFVAIMLISAFLPGS